jgi:hypothetical protein
VEDEVRWRQMFSFQTFNSEHIQLLLS